TGCGSLNLLSTVGALLLAVGTIPFLAAAALAFREPAGAPDDPWEGNSLEWATSSPPPRHNFRRLPPIRSERPVFDARMARAGIDPAAVGVEPDVGPPGAGAADVAE